MDQRTTESGPARAWKDTVQAFGWPLSKVFEAACAIGFVVGMAFIMPDDASNRDWAVFEIGAAIVGAASGFVVIWGLHLLLAPYRQRNEARQKIRDLQAQLEERKLFDVVCPTTFLGLPINRLDDGSYRASVMGVGPVSILIAHLRDLTTVTSLTASLQVRFAWVDNRGWETTNAIRVAPALTPNPLAGPQARGFTWDTSDPQLWKLIGLPLVMAKDELLHLPMMMITVVDGNEAGAHFEKGEVCTLIVSLAVRTDKGAPPLPDQVISLTRSDVKDSLTGLGIELDTAEGSSTQ